MNLNKDKLNELIRDPKAWATLGAVLVALVGIFGVTFSDNAVVAWETFVAYMTGG